MDITREHVERSLDNKLLELIVLQDKKSSKFRVELKKYKTAVDVLGNKGFDIEYYKEVYSTFEQTLE